MLISDRASITALCERGDGREWLLGRYGYKTNLCPHGIARGAADLAHFLREHWGDPVTFHRPGLTAPTPVLDHTGAEPEDQGLAPANEHERARDNVAPKLSQLQGLIAFIDIDRDRAQGHIDIWNLTECKGHEFWNARKIYFWKLE